MKTKLIKICACGKPWIHSFPIQAESDRDSERRGELLAGYEGRVSYAPMPPRAPWMGPADPETCEQAKLIEVTL